jgi:membrane protein YqaA with SNARE-associated domain
VCVLFRKRGQIEITSEVFQLIQIAGEVLRVVVNWSLGRGVQERDTARERERENVGENIPDFVGWLLVVATIYLKS